MGIGDGEKINALRDGRVIEGCPSGCLDPEGCGCEWNRSQLRRVDLATRRIIEEERIPVGMDDDAPTTRPYDAARSTLETAADYVAGPRSAHYGHPLDNHTRTAYLMGAYLRAKALTMSDAELVAAIRAGDWLEAEDVCWLNATQKLARDIHAPKPDGVVDVAGYAANVAEIRAERDRREGVK